MTKDKNVTTRKRHSTSKSSLFSFSKWFPSAAKTTELVMNKISKVCGYVVLPSTEIKSMQNRLKELEGKLAEQKDEGKKKRKSSTSASKKKVALTQAANDLLSKFENIRRKPSSNVEAKTESIIEPKIAGISPTQSVSLMKRPALPFTSSMLQVLLYSMLAILVHLIILTSVYLFFNLEGYEIKA